METRFRAPDQTGLSGIGTSTRRMKSKSISTGSSRRLKKAVDVERTSFDADTGMDGSTHLVRVNILGLAGITVDGSNFRILDKKGVYPPLPNEMSAVVAISRDEEIKGMTSLSKPLTRSPTEDIVVASDMNGDDQNVEISDGNSGESAAIQRHVAVWASGESSLGSLISFEVNLDRLDQSDSVSTRSNYVPKSYQLSIGLAETASTKENAALPIGIANLNIAGDRWMQGEVLVLDLPVLSLKRAKPLSSNIDAIDGQPKIALRSSRRKTNDGKVKRRNPIKRLFGRVSSSKPSPAPSMPERKVFSSVYSADSSGDAILRVQLQVVEKGMADELEGPTFFNEQLISPGAHGVEFDDTSDNSATLGNSSKSNEGTVDTELEESAESSTDSSPGHHDPGAIYSPSLQTDDETFRTDRDTVLTDGDTLRTDKDTVLTEGGTLHTCDDGTISFRSHGSFTTQSNESLTLQSHESGTIISDESGTILSGETYSIYEGSKSVVSKQKEESVRCDDKEGAMSAANIGETKGNQDTFINQAVINIFGREVRLPNCGPFAMSNFKKNQSARFFDDNMTHITGDFFGRDFQIPICAGMKANYDDDDENESLTLNSHGSISTHTEKGSLKGRKKNGLSDYLKARKENTGNDLLHKAANHEIAENQVGPACKEEAHLDQATQGSSGRSKNNDSIVTPEQSSLKKSEKLSSPRGVTDFENTESKLTHSFAQIFQCGPYTVDDQYTKTSNIPELVVPSDLDSLGDLTANTYERMFRKVKKEKKIRLPVALGGSGMCSNIDLVSDDVLTQQKFVYPNREEYTGKSSENYFSDYDEYSFKTSNIERSSRKIKNPPRLENQG